ncbi:MAG: NADH-quinone oxidoreductase subunit A [Pyrinomonadaceae bacterium]
MAMIFILFDIEVIFLLPWAVVFKTLMAEGLGMLAYVEMMTFVGLLLVGYIYVVKKRPLRLGRTSSH